jgi:aryl-alcohol dehydrogenase-like predicted oxidoreductase
MHYVPFGRTGVKVSPLTLGCMMFGGKTSPEDSARIIDRALDAGINIVDTANIYNEGRSEEATGAALKRNGKRARVFLATKVHRPMDATDPNAGGLSRRHIIAECEASLRRLQTDYIDLYQLHRQQTDTAIDETLRALDDLVRAGKVRYLGTSTWAAWQVTEALWCSDRHHLNRFVCEQPPYNLLDRRIERELIPMAQTFGFGIIPWSPLAGGLLSGKYHRDEPPPADSRFGQMATNPMQRRRWTESIFGVTEGLQPIADAKGVSLSQLAIAWCMSRPGVTSAIIGPRTMEQLEDNLGALTIELTADDHRAIDHVAPRGRMVSPFYEAEFGPNPFRALV